MRVSLFAAPTSTSSIAKQFHRVLLLSALVMTASLSSWAQITVSVAKVTFSKTILGATSVSKAVTITNKGASSQAVNLVTSADFSESDTCAGNVAAGKTCKVTFSFTPTLVGTISGATGIYDNSSNLLAFVGLSGTGAAPVTVVPTSLKFVSGTIGTQSAAQSFTITNSTTGTVNITGISNVTDYQINTGTCLAASLPAAGSCTVSVQVTPTSTVDDGSIIVTDDAPGGLPLVVKVTSAATAVTNPISLSKTSLTFKAAAGGTSAAQTITVKNISTGVVALGTITASSNYTISSNNCPSSLALKGTCVFGIEFQPTFVGSINGTASVPFTTSNNNSPLVVNLTGTSLAPLTFLPAKLAFASQPEFTTSAAQAVTITNNSANAITLNSVVATPNFQVQPSGSTCSLAGGSLAANSACTVEVQFAPTVVGTSIVGSLTVSNNASPNPLLVPLSGVSTASSGFTLSAAPSTLSIAQGGNGTSTITVNPLNGFTGSVNLAVASTLPSGVTASFNPTSTTTSSVLTLTASASATTGGPIAVTISGTSGSLTQTTTISLTVTASGPNFTLSAAPSSVSIAQGGNGTSTITVNPTNGFNGAVSLAVTSTLPSGVTASFNPSSTTTTSVLTLTASASATIGGPTTVTITGTSGGLTQTTTVSLTVTAGPNYTLTAAPSSVSIVQGGNGTSTITVNPTNGFNGTVNLSVTSTLPTGVTASFNPSSTTTTSVLTLTASASATIGGPTTVTITGTSGGLTQTTTVNLTVTAPPNFTLTAAPSSVSIAQGGNGTSTITVNPTNGFNGSVSLSVTSTLPTGVTASFNPSSTTTTSVLTLTASASATVGGPTTVTITGTSGGLTKTTTVSLTVTAQPNFTLTAAPSSVSIAQGNDGTSTITVNPTNGFNGTVSLSVTSTLPSGVTASFNPTSTTSTSVLTLTASGSATTGGPTTVTITGTSGGLTQTTTVSLTVTAGPSYTLTAAPNSLSIVQGSNGTSTITVNPTNGFNSNVSLAVTSGLPSGVTASFNPSTTTTTSVLTLTASASATTGGPVTVTVTGISSGGMVQTTTISLTVTASAAFTLTAAPSSLSIAQGSNGTSTITVNPGSGFNGTVSLAVTSTLPTGVTASFNPSSTSTTSVLTLTASASATVGGPTTVTITGTSGGLTQTTTVNLTVTPPPTYTLTAAPSSVSVAQGSNGTSTITVNPANGFNGSVSLAVTSTLPTGVTASFNPSSTSTTSVLTLTASVSATIGGPTTVTITGTSGGLTQTTTVSLTVTAPPNFTLTATPSSVSIAQGGNGTSTITVNPTNGFNGSVSLSVTSTLPTGVTASFNPTSTSTTSVLTLTASASATIGGPTTVTVTGTSGGLTQTTTVSLTVTAPQSFTLSAAPGSVSIAQASNGTSTITVNPTNGFNGTVSLSITSSLPSGVTASFNPSSTGSTSLLTLTASASATVGGPTTVTIKGVSGGLTQTTTISLTVTTAVPASAVINPGSAHQGSNETVVITGTATSFGAGTTVSFGGSDITTGPLTVNGPTSLSAPITVTSGATTGSRTVTITTGSKVVTTTFTVLAGVPAITLIDANNIAPTASQQSVQVSGAFTSWANGSTLANFGPGISVGGAAAGTFGPVQVSGGTNFGATLTTNGAAVGYRTVQIKTGSQILTVNNGIYVETCGSTAPSVVQVSPVNNSSNAPVNTQIQVQFSVPMNRTSLTLGGSGTVFFFDTNNASAEVPGNISVDASGTIATITPTTALNAGDQYNTFVSNSKPFIKDACGNILPFQQYAFNTAFVTDVTGPTLTGTSPVNGDTNIPRSGSSSATPVVLQFNTPIDPITAQTGFSMTTGGNYVAGNFTYSPDDTTVTFTPAAPLAASTTYTVNYTATITDAPGNSITNPGSFSFTTGSATDTVAPSVVLVVPSNNTFGVGVNATPHLTFSEPVNGLTIPTALSLVYADTGVMIPAAVTVSANRMTAWLTPTAPLLPNTAYTISLAPSYTDLAGNLGSASSTSFFTGAGAVSNAVTVTAISPNNGQAGVPLNTQVIAVMSNNIDLTTVTNSSITVTPSGGSAIAGTVTLASDGATLTFVPTSALTATTVYNVSVNGFADIDGNAVTAFASSFTTGSTSFGSGSFTVVSTSPVNGATGVSVTSPVTFTMSNLINAASVNANTVYISVANSGQVETGTYNVSGAAVTFTPLAQYPANTLMNMTVCNLTDEAGNSDCQGFSFTTASTADQTPPTVTISPANGATNVGLNTQVVLSFSESINPSTITTNTVALFNGDTALNYGYSISRDNRTIVLNPAGNAFTSGATITVELGSGIQDLSGNALANTSSHFTVTTALPNTQPNVVTMSPGNGATGVPTTTVVTLFTSAAMNAATVAGALHVTDNGTVVTGTVQLFSNGQAIEFTPSVPFFAGDTIGVFLDSSALSAANVPLQSFSGQFTIATAPAKTQASVIATNPLSDAIQVPLNVPIQIEYNQALDPNTINNTTIGLVQNGTTVLTPTLSLINGQVINIAPTSNLVAGAQYSVFINYNGPVNNTKGVKVQSYELDFTAGSAADNAVPTIVSLAPANNSTNIGTNALVSVNFNKPINAVSVTGSTIQLSAGPTVVVPSSISFSPDFTRVSITPMTPLPPSTQMTITINGVTSVAGKPVATTTTHFNTQAQPDVTSPFVVNASVQNGQTGVPVNSVLTMQFSKAMDIGSVDVATVGVFTQDCGDGAVPATTSWSADQTTISIVPTSALAVGTQYFLYSDALTDLSGNLQQDLCSNFTTSFSTNGNPPTVVNTSPENAETQVPVNAPVQILFSEPINPTTVGQVTLTTGGNPVAFTPTFNSANQLLTLTPVLPLLANANYSVTITAVKDTAGNQMTAPVTNTFSTGPTFDVLQPSVILADPATGSTGIGTNVAPRLVFNERLNPLSVVSSGAELFYNGSVQLFNNTTGQWVPVTVSMSADRLTATITPKSPLQPSSSYKVFAGTNATYYDVAGNAGASYSGTFWTGLASDTTHNTVTTISPVNAQTGVPLNAQVVAVVNDGIDPTTITNSSIAVTPSGGSAIAGTVTLASDGVTLTFVPAAALSPSTVYNVSVGGFNDAEGNSFTTFNSSFTTGTSSFGAGSFTVLSTSPVSGATGVTVTSPVTFTMSNLINAASVGSSSVQVRILSTQAVVAGTYNVSGAAVTFTPLSPYPASTQMGMYVTGITDEAGNSATSSAGSFTTANSVDSTAPTVTITPANGTTNAGLNTQVVLTFSKSINPATITSSSVNLLNGDVPINPATSISRDNRTVVLNYNSAALPAGVTITVTANNLVTDLSGNALASTTSQFTTTATVSNTAPFVINMRPGNGATNVPGNTVITLFTNTAMNAGTLSSALHVSQNGVLISGTTNVGSNGQSVQFTPSSALAAGSSIQVVLDATAQDIFGNSLQYFSGSFTVAGSLTNTGAQVQAVNPFPSATVPLNTVIQFEFNQPLKASTINSTNVVLFEFSSGTFLTPTLTLSPNGQLITMTPMTNLTAGSQYFATVSYGAGIVQNIDGVPVQPFELDFTAGSSTDTVAPTILTVSPPNLSPNIGTNAAVSVDFNKAVNPVSVTGSSIQLSGGSVTEVPSSISFTTDYTRAMIVPQAPLPSSTQMAIAINGVTSTGGASVAPQTTHFTTMAGADFVTPQVVNSSVQAGQTVGDNATLFALQFNKAMDAGSADGAAIGLSSFFCGVPLQFQFPATLSWSADQTTAFLVPQGALDSSTTYYLYSYNLTDLTGNPQQNFCVSFVSSAGNDTAGPAVKQVNPPSGFTGVPINAPVQILFSEPISAVSVGGVTLKQGSTVIPTIVSLYDGNRGLQLLPKLPLAPSTVYTINVTGVKDITGNTQSSFPSQSFTTGTGTGLVAPTVVSSIPTSGATSVAVTTTVQVLFNEAMDPASFDPNNSFVLKDGSNNIVPATITFSADYKTATLHPTSNLAGGGVTYTMFVGSNSNPPLQDLGGNSGGNTSFSFTTQ